MHISIKNDWIGLNMYDFDTGSWYESDFEKDETINQFYSCPVEISQDLTIKGLVSTLRLHAWILDHDFDSWLNGIKVEDIWKEVCKPIDMLHNLKYATLIKRQIFAKRYDIVDDVKWTSHESIQELSLISEDGFEHRPAFNQIHNIKDLNLQLGNCLLYQIGQSSTEIEEADAEWTLLEVLIALFESLTLAESEEYIENDENDESTTKTIQLFEINQLKDLLQECTEKEEYEACARIQAEIKRLESL